MFTAVFAPPSSCPPQASLFSRLTWYKLSCQSPSLTLLCFSLHPLQNKTSSYSLPRDDIDFVSFDYCYFQGIEVINTYLLFFKNQCYLLYTLCLLCMFICECIVREYACVYMYECMCEHAYACLWVTVCVCLSVCQSACVDVYVYVWVCGCVCGCAHPCVNVRGNFER